LELRSDHGLVSLLLVVLLAGFARADENVAVFAAGWQEPQVAVSPVGHVFVVAAKDGVIAVASSADGKSFGKPATVATVEKLMCGMRRGPRIAAGARSLVVTAISSESGDLVAWRSTDQGATWLGPVRVNGVARSAREGLDGLAADDKDDFAVVWLDDRKGGKEVWEATSTDGGATWKEGRVYASPDGHVCECCHPSVAWDAKGEIGCMWRNWLAGARDFWFAKSSDRGATWSDAIALGGPTWRLNACPMDGGALVRNYTQGGFLAAFMCDGVVYLGVPGEGPAKWGKGRQPWLAAGHGGVGVWLDGDALTAATASAGGVPKPFVRGATDPCVAGSFDLKGPIVTAWASSQGVLARQCFPRSP
jgi:hypothetical protein